MINTMLVKRHLILLKGKQTKSRLLGQNQNCENENFISRLEKFLKFSKCKHTKVATRQVYNQFQEPAAQEFGFLQG